MAKNAIAAAVIVAQSLGTSAALAGPDGSLWLFPNTINPADGAAGAVNFSRCSAPVTVLFNGFLGRVSVFLVRPVIGSHEWRHRRCRVLPRGSRDRASRRLDRGYGSRPGHDARRRSGAAARVRSRHLPA